MGFQVGTGTGVTRRAAFGVINVQSNVIGNVGAGPDDLHSYTLPANTGISNDTQLLNWRAMGTIANNANAKIVDFIFGAQTLLSVTMPTSILADWHAFVRLFRGGTSRCVIHVRVTDRATGTITAFAAALNLTTTWTATNIMKIVASTVTSDNDVVQNLTIISAE